MKPYYDCDGITIYHGDCREVLPTLPKFDLLLSDPPYGVTQQKWDSVESVMQTIELAPLAVFTTGERLLAALITAMPQRFRHIWVWDRVNHFTDFLNANRRPMRSHELIAVFSKKPRYHFEPVFRQGETKVRSTTSVNGKGGNYGYCKAPDGYGSTKKKLYPCSILSFKGCKSNGRVHPTEKPVSLFGYLLQSYPADVTVDPWMGSGTTLVAAKREGRKAVGIELEERYCEAAVKRLQQSVFDFDS